MFNPLIESHLEFISPDKIRVSAYAKVNLTLKVLAKLTNDFHCIRSVLCPISLHDKIVIERKEVGQQEIGSLVSELIVEYSQRLENHLLASQGVDPLTQHSMAVLASPNNLVVRAANEMFSRYFPQPKYNLCIRLYKDVPFGAGLGGGSADAAAVIYGINRLFDLKLTFNDLLEVASSLGSDVAALLLGQLALVQGTGKYVKKINPSPAILTSLRELSLVIVKPAISVSTGLAYSLFGFAEETCNECQVFEEEAFSQIEDISFLYLNSKELSASLADKRLTFSKQAGISGKPVLGAKDKLPATFFVNDFEPVVYSKYSDLFTAVELLKTVGSYKVMLAGSGAALLGFFSSEGEARDAVSELSSNKIASGWFVAQTSLMFQERN